MEEEHKIEKEEKAVEEIKLVPYDPIKAGKKISLEIINDTEVGPSGNNSNLSPLFYYILR